MTQEKKSTEKKPKHMKKGEKLQPKLNTFQTQVLQAQTVEWIMAGKPRQEILKLIQEHVPPGIQVSEVWALHFYQSSKLAIEQDLSEETVSIVSSHIYWYEHIYAYFRRINFISGMNRALMQKERLLGLRKEEVSVKINNTQNINFNREEKFDVKKLDKKEQSRLEALLKKASVV